MELIIRKMNHYDINGVLEIENASFPIPWSQDSFIAELRNPLALYIVAVEGPLIQGYGGVWKVFDEAHVTNVAVHPRARNRGIGEMLMNRIIEVMVLQGVSWLSLEVRPSNDSARNLYERLNFRQVGVRKGYYSDNGEDALLMTRQLTEESDRS